MPLVLADRVNETTTTTSTGTITLAGAVSGYQSFAVIGNGNTTYYTIVHQTANEWEVGIGTYTSSGTLLSRDTVLASSNSGSLVNFSAGTKFVFCDYPAGRAVYLDTATNVTIPGLTLSSGNLAFTSTAQRITADMSNGTVSNRFAFQNSVTNAQSIVSILPNGTGTVSQLQLFNNSTPTNAPFAGLFAGASDARIVSGVQGSGSYLPLTFYTNGSEQMRLNTSGNLGIGTASPAYRLDVQGASGVGMQIFETSTGNSNRLIVTQTGTVSRFTSTYSSGSGNFAWNIGGSEFMRLDASGNLGIGTASPGVKLDVVGAIRSSTTTSGSTVSATTDFRLNNATFSRVAIGDGGGGWLGGYSITYSGGAVYSDTGAISGIYYTNGGNIQFYAGGSAAGGTAAPERMRLDSSGNLLVGTTAGGAAGIAIPTSFNYSFSEGSNNSYANFFRQVNTAAAVLAHGYKRSATSGFASSIGVSVSRAAIAVGYDNGAISFFSDTATNVANGTDVTPTERMRIDSAGRFLLGASSNTSRGGSNTTALFYKASGTQYLDIQTGTSGDSGLLFSATSSSTYGLINYSNSVNAMLFYANSAERMRLDSSGNLGLGTSSVLGKMSVQTAAASSFSVRDSQPVIGVTGVLLENWNSPAAASTVPFAIRAADFRFGTDSGGSFIERLRIDTSGNVGIGVTPSAWETANSVRALQFNGGSVFSYSNAYIFVGQNFFRNSGGVEVYVNTAAATKYEQSFGAHTWANAPSGTAGAGITFTERMRLDSSGNLGIGTTTPRGNLDVGTATASAITRSIHLGYSSADFYGFRLANTNTAASFAAGTFSIQRGSTAAWTSDFIMDNTGKVAIAEGNNPTQVLSLYRGGSTNAIMSAGNSNTGLDGTWFGVDTAGNGIVNVRGAFPLIFSTSALERARITSAGRLGIATTIPEVDLQIGADTSTTRALSVRYSSVPLYLSGGFDGTNALSTFSTNAYANATGSGQSWTSFSNTGYGASAIQLASFTTGADIRFLTAATANTNPTERARISAAGQLFVGGTTNSYNSALHLYNVNGGTSGSVLESYVTGTTSAYHAIYLNANGAVGSISTSGTATAFNTSSDYRLKDNIAPADSAGAVIDAIEVVKHDWKVGGHTRYGMIAQDLHMVAPEAVSVGDADDVEDFKNPWGVDYSKLVPMLVKEVQSLRARLAAAGL